ncbi:MAG: lysophospholipid acyltransferase family protein [Akkermansia sp.]|nr:lysophospholipid acyltransferase family protein [Akkermansia sp.]
MSKFEYAKMVDIKDLLDENTRLPAIVASSAEKLLGLERLNKAYDKIVRDKVAGSTENFFQLATKYLNLRLQLRPGDLDNIPKKGPVVVVANHPHGLSDGIMFGELLTRVREDVRILANEQLSLCEELDPWLIKVDVYEDENAVRKNLAGMRKMISWLRNGGVLGIFPAGTASSFSMAHKHVTDDPWNTNIASIIRMTKATVVPVYFPGRNSLLFQGISLINRKARVAFLPREVGRDSRRPHRIVVGKPISFSQLNQYESDEAMVSHLRLRTYLLGKSYDKSRRQHVQKKNKKSKMATLIPPVSVQEIQAEIDALPPECLHARQEKGDWDVYVADAVQIPKILIEIGRLREYTFRQVGEGSGNACDLDTYDNHYKHLFLWDRVNQKIAGAYRMGEVDKIVARYGVKGLYNSEFFNFSPKAMEVLAHSLEMGRAFIVPEYQKRPLALGFIWEGIGQFMARNSQYRYLFGTVSISREYTNLSRALIVSYLKAHEMNEELCGEVKSYAPPKKVRLKRAESAIFPIGLNDAQALSQLVADVEHDNKGIPVLLRQYLKLNGKILSFSVDKHFGDVLDCLILVDIFKSPPRSIKRYLGKGTYEKLKPLLMAAGIEVEDSEN